MVEWREHNTSFHESYGKERWSEPTWEYIGVAQPEPKKAGPIERVITFALMFGVTVGFWWGLIRLGLWAAGW